jgi:hypothetical protein
MTVGLFGLFLMSVWSFLDDPLTSCGSCGQSVHSTAVAMAGMCVYAVLLLATRHAKSSPWVPWGIAAAFGAHAFLISNLVAQGNWCARCGAAAVLSAAVMILAMLQTHARPLRLAFVSCACAGLLQTLAPSILQSESSSKVLALLQASDLDPSMKSVSVVVFQMQGTNDGEAFASRIAPSIRNEFQADEVRIVVREHSVDALVSPSFVVARTREDAAVIVGNADFSAFRGRILMRLKKKG